MAQITVGNIPETDYSTYDSLLDYPHLYKSINDDFTKPGLTLTDTLTCTVSWNSNEFPTLQMTYPRDGVHMIDIQQNRYIMADFGYKFVHQIFKITHVQQELDNIIVNAEHISATLNDSTVYDLIQFGSASAQDVMNQILNTMQPQRDFTFDSDVSTVSNVNIQGGQQVGALLIDPDQEGDTATQSILGLYGGELEFDNFDIHHSVHAGHDSGVVIDYGKNIQAFNHDVSNETMWTGAVFIAKYTPGQAIATETNVNWNAWSSDYSNVCSYAAGGAVNIYDSPVEGQHIIGTLSSGMKLHLGSVVHNGDFTPDNKFQINTVNGDDWYPISPSDGGGWIDANWINFDTSGSYLVSNITGDVTVQSNNPYDESGAGTRVSMSGSAVVAYKQGGSIHVYYSPEIGPDHYRIPGWTVSNGTVIDYDMVERNSNGDLWYRIGDHQWLYGPHLSLTQDGAYKSYDNYGYGYIKDKQTKYHWDKKKNKMVPTTKTITTGSKSKNHSSGKYWSRKKKKVKVTAHKGKVIIDKTITQGGVTYQHTKYGWVKSSSISYQKNGSVKPHSYDDILKDKLKDHSKVEIYATPDKTNALNWSIPNGTKLTVLGHEAKGGDGKTYVEVSYAGKTGWLSEDNIDNNNSNLHSPDDTIDSDSDTDTDISAAVDQSQKEVTVVVGPLYANGFGTDPNIDKANTVDLSSNFSHDDQDLSGQQPDGSFVATQADIDELTTLGQNYLTEHKYGKLQITDTITYQEMSGINADWNKVSLYDYVHVKFDKYHLNELEEVNAIVWDCLAHHYQSITIGKLPEPWQHLLTQQIDKKSNERASRLRGNINRLSDFVGTVQHALKLEGSSREEAFKKLALKLGDAQEKVDDNGKKIIQMNEDMGLFQKHMEEMANSVDNFSKFIKTGPSAPLHFVNSSGQEDLQNPVAIVAQGSDHSFELNSNGLIYTDSSGGTHAAFGVDDSTGELKGNFFVDEAHIPVLDASHIQTDTIHALGTIDGSLSVSNGYSNIQIGNSFGGTEFGIYIDSGTYITSNDFQLGSGSVGTLNASEITLGNMDITGSQITRYGDEHVMWSSSQYTNLGQYIKAHIKSSVITGL